MPQHTVPGRGRVLATQVLSFALLCGLLIIGVVHPATAEETEHKPDRIRDGAAAAPEPALFRLPDPDGGEGHRIVIGEGDHQVPVVVVRGTPYEMGWHLGRLMREEIRQFLPVVLKKVTHKLETTPEALQEVWSRTAAYADNRVEQELAGVADGAELPLSMLQAVHAMPLVMPYSCSSIAAWGEATVDGHLYQTRNLDWILDMGAHDVPVIVVYLPDEGVPHVVPSFAGFIGAHTGMNLRGITLAEMGDSPAAEMPYPVHAPHFTVYFRTMLYDARSLDQALEIFSAQPMTKRYHFVFGDGREQQRAVKVRAHAPEPEGRRLSIWRDNDPEDEFAPHVLPCVVYNDEGRGAFPTLKELHGRLDGEALIRLANQIPIKGGNVTNVVYDATGLKLWISYARGDEEAYLRPYVFLDLTTLDATQNGQPDLAEFIQ
jgi:isopenicillin-N N-acyltransferase like protein